MKAAMIVIGSLAGLYAVFGVVQFVRTLMASDAGTAYGGAAIAAGVAPPCIGLVVCLICFRLAFRGPRS
jgi:hypothetical protein